jgi:hypothetical protein
VNAGILPAARRRRCPGWRARRVDSIFGCARPADDGIVVSGVALDDYLSGPEEVRRRELVWGQRSLGRNGMSAQFSTLLEGAFNHPQFSVGLGTGGSMDLTTYLINGVTDNGTIVLRLGLRLRF